MMLGFVLMSIVGGQLISRTGRYKLQALVGSALSVVGLALFSQVSLRTTTGEVTRDMILVGLAVGATMPIYSTVLISAFPHQALGTVNAARQTFINLSGATVIPVMSAVLVATFTRDVAQSVPAPLRPSLASLTPQSLLTVRHALVNGISQVFTIALALAAGALLLTILLPRIELSSDWERKAVDAKT